MWFLVFSPGVSCYPKDARKTGGSRGCKGQTMIIAQISDCHVLAGGRLLAGRFDTGAAFGRLIEAVARLTTRPDVIVFSGDLGEDATAEEYAMVGDGLRSLGIPVRAVPGNHDLRAPMLAALPDMVGATAEGHLNIVEDGFPLVLVGLDTLVEGASHGALCAARLAWLEETLARHAERPVLLFQHHPPITTGLQAMDRIGLLEGRAALADLVTRHGRVEAILCGHMHRAIQGRCGGAPVRVAPSASHQIAFDLRPEEPYRLLDEPAQFTVHIWDPDDGLISHIVPV
jgi:3',5'-cyclic AMP phosphodiesterase CpdA